MRSALFTLLLLAAPAWSGELKIAGETKYESHSLVRLRAEGHDPKAGLIWRVSPRIDGTSKAETSREKLQFAAPPGSYTVDLLAVKLGTDGVTEVDEVTVTVTIAGPAPPPGPTPGPGPSPQPPNPPPPSGGMRVLFVFESGQILTAGQHAVIYSREVRDYLAAKCEKGPGGLPEARFYDQHVQLAPDTAQHWRDMLARPRTKLPWIVISSIAGLHEGPLPGSVEEAMALLRKYGGQ